MRYEVLQSTQYEYSEPVRQSINQCIFKPLSNQYQKLISYEQTISPMADYAEHRNYWKNDVVTFYIWETHQQLEVQTRSILELIHQPLFVNITADVEVLMGSEHFRQNFAEFLMMTPYTTLSANKIKTVVNELKRVNQNQYQFVERLNTYIYDNFSYVPGSTDVKTIAEEAYDKKMGVCQDFTHLMIAICRSEGIPARYVSGYIYSGEDVAMRGDSVTHAWVEVYFPTHGWIGFDPTNNMLAQNQHISVATGRDYSDITPLKGVYLGNGTQKLSVSIRVKLLEGSF